MRNINTLIKSIFSCLLIWWLFSITFAATSQKWRDILEQLEDDWRTDDEIRQAMKDLWYNPVDYLWVQTNPKLTVVNWNSSNSNTNNYSNGTTSKLWRDILNQLKREWRTDDEIKKAIEDLWYDSSAYFPSRNSTTSNSSTTSNWSTYISRSCKPYTVEYIQSLNAYTSPDLKKREYFVNIDYFKRYVDSKNAQNAECYIGWWWISNSYVDTYNGTDRYTAPNWKIYFISQQNWAYTSNELSVAKSFSTIDELRSYIRKRNPLINMWVTNNYLYSSNQQNIQPNIVPTEDSLLNNVVRDIQHWTPETTTTQNQETTTWQQNTQNTQTNQQANNETQKEEDSDIISNLLNQLFN